MAALNRESLRSLYIAVYNLSLYTILSRIQERDHNRFCSQVSVLAMSYVFYLATGTFPPPTLSVPLTRTKPFVILFSFPTL